MVYLTNGSVSVVPLGTIPYQLRDVPVYRRGAVQLRTMKPENGKALDTDQ